MMCNILHDINYIAPRLDWAQELQIIKEAGYDLPLWAIASFMNRSIKSWWIDGEADTLTIEKYGYEPFVFYPDKSKRPFFIP